MRIALLSPIAWRTPPRHYGPWEQVVSNICEGLKCKGIDVTLFATGDSQTTARLEYICPRPYEEDREIYPKVWECLHIANLFEQAEGFDIIHNNFDFLPLTYTRFVKTPMVTTIHGFSSQKILPVYKRYNKDKDNYYVSISMSDRSPELEYIDNVYNGINIEEFEFNEMAGDYLLFFGRIHHDKGTGEAIQIAHRFRMRLIIAGIIHDRGYFEGEVEPYIDGDRVVFIGHAGPQKRSKLLGGAYALLHPINFKEPFGLSVVEAMACGTPVVAFKKGSMPELIKDSETGYLVDNIEEAKDALKKVKELDRRACREWVKERFSREKMVEDYIRVYEKILSNT